MARLDGPDVEQKIIKAFGLSGPEELTGEQVFLLVAVAKHARLRCRSNAALYNWIKRCFPSLAISTVKMESKFRVGEMYDALKVINPISGVRSEEEEDHEL